MEVRYVVAIGKTQSHWRCFLAWAIVGGMHIIILTETGMMTVSKLFKHTMHKPKSNSNRGNATTRTE